MLYQKLRKVVDCLDEALGLGRRARSRFSALIGCHKPGRISIVRECNLLLGRRKGYWSPKSANYGLEIDVA